MAKPFVTRLAHESHAELWAHFLRFGVWQGGSPPTSLAGRQFTRWTVLGLEGWGAGGTKWLCRCACGTIRAIKASVLIGGRSRSCGCLAREEQITHGMSRSRPYKIWAGMLSRCRNPECDAFADYGGRGIEACERWTRFAEFWADMEAGYAPRLTLERRDVNGNYEPGNCEWVTKSAQLQNLRRTVRIETPRGVMTLTQAAGAFGIPRETLRARIRYGWPPGRLLEGYCSAPPLQR